MQISRTFLLVCAAAFCAALLPLRAAEPDLQNKLQEALDKKLNEKGYILPGLGDAGDRLFGV